MFGRLNKSYGNYIILIIYFVFLLCFLSEQWVAFVLNTKLDLWKNLDCNVVLYMYQMLEEIRYIFLNKIVDIVIKICYSYRVTKIKRVKFARISPQSVGFSLNLPTIERVTIYIELTSFLFGLTVLTVGLVCALYFFYSFSDGT